MGVGDRSPEARGVARSAQSRHRELYRILLSSHWTAEARIYTLSSSDRAQFAPSRRLPASRRNLFIGWRPGEGRSAVGQTGGDLSSSLRGVRRPPSGDCDLQAAVGEPLIRRRGNWLGHAPALVNVLLARRGIPAKSFPRM